MPVRTTDVEDLLLEADNEAVGELLREILKSIRKVKSALEVLQERERQEARS